MTAATADDVLTQCRNAGVRLVRFLYCDNGAVVRGKVVPVEHLAERMRTGIGLTVVDEARALGWAQLILAGNAHRVYGDGAGQ